MGCVSLLLVLGQTLVEAVQGVPGHALLTAVDGDAAGGVWIAVGGDLEEGPGEILRSADGGETWTTIPEIGTGRLYDVKFLGDERVLAVGLRGRILLSTDAGASWAMVRQADDWLAGIAFPTRERGWVVGSKGRDAVLLRSTDAGSTWVVGPALPEVCARSPLRAIAFRDAEVGCIVGEDGALLITRDGGSRWVAAETGGGYLRGIDHVAREILWICGSPGILMHSPDGGNTWNRRPVDGGSKFNSIRFADEGLGWVTSMQGELFETRDGGDSWSLIHRTQGLHLTGLAPPRKGRPGFLVGDRGTVLRLRAANPALDAN